MPSTAGNEPPRGTETGTFSQSFRDLETPHLDGYVVHSVLGAGGHSTVYLADDSSGKQVAIKQWRAADWSKNVRRRVAREVDALKKLDHPHLATFVALIQDAKGNPCVVMEAIHGRNLAEEIEASGPLDMPQLLKVAVPLLDAIVYLADQGLVHRDIKPANVVLRAEDGLPVLVDFSIVKQATPSQDTATLTEAGAGLGTSAYMAPEQCEGDLGAVGARTDVYGFGALLFHAVTGLPPWSRESGWERTQRNPWQQPYPAQRIERERVEAAKAKTPRALGRVIAACLHGEATKRYKSATELREDLLTVSSPASSPRSSWLRMAGAGIALTAVAAVAWGSFDHSSSFDPNHVETRDTKGEEYMNGSRSMPMIAIVTTAMAAGSAIAQDEAHARGVLNASTLDATDLPETWSNYKRADYSDKSLEQFVERSESLSPEETLLLDDRSTDEVRFLSCVSTRHEANVVVMTHVYESQCAAIAGYANAVEEFRERHAKKREFAGHVVGLLKQEVMVLLNVRHEAGLADSSARSIARTVAQLIAQKLPKNGVLHQEFLSPRPPRRSWVASARLASYRQEPLVSSLLSSIATGDTDSLEEVCQLKDQTESVRAQVASMRAKLIERDGFDLEDIQLLFVVTRSGVEVCATEDMKADLYVGLCSGDRLGVVKLNNCLRLNGKWHVTDSIRRVGPIGYDNFRWPFLPWRVQ